MRVLLIAVAIAICCSAILGQTGAPPPKVLPWDEVKAAIAETLCVQTAEHEGKEYGAGSSGDIRTCGHGEQDTPLRKAVASAFDKAKILVASVEIDVGDIMERPKDPAARNAAFRERWFADDRLMRAVVPRVVKALNDENLACQGCPTFSAPAVKRVSWDVFGRYVGAYVYPDPVRTPTDASGKPTGRPRYSFHICVGLNGISEMKNPDPALTRAAFVAMFGDKTIRGKAGEYFQDILSDSNFEKLAGDADRTAYLRKHLSAKVASDSVVRATVCERLRMFVTDLAIEVSDCPASATDKPKPPA